MNKQLTEILVGFFVLTGLICVAYMTIKLGRLDIIESDSYTVLAKFESISGIKKGANVEVAGIMVGRVTKTYLDVEEQVAVIEMNIGNDVKLGDDVIASVKSTGLIGDRYISLALGGSEDFLQDGDFITETEASVDLMELISKYAFGAVE